MRQIVFLRQELYKFIMYCESLQLEQNYQDWKLCTY